MFHTYKIVLLQGIKTAVKASLLFIVEQVVCPNSLLIGSYGSDPSSVILPFKRLFLSRWSSQSNAPAAYMTPSFDFCLSSKLLPELLGSFSRLVLSLLYSDNVNHLQLRKQLEDSHTALELAKTTPRQNDTSSKQLKGTMPEKEDTPSFQAHTASMHAV